MMITSKILLVTPPAPETDRLLAILKELNYRDEHLVLTELCQEAIYQTCCQKFDLILLDLFLPDSQGLKTLISLQSATSHIPIVIISDLDDQNLTLEVINLGCQDFLVKNQITPTLLEKTIQMSIARSAFCQKQQHQDNLFHKIFQYIFQFTVLLDQQGTILQINQTVLGFAGVTEKEAVGSKFWDLNIWGEQHANKTNLQKAIDLASQGEFVRYEVQIMGMAQQIIDLDFSIKPVKNELGKVVLLIAEARDISEHKFMENTILKALTKEKELSELQSQLVTTVSHEFRTPLSVIVLSLGLLEGYSQSWSEEKKLIHFQRIKKSVQRMTELLDYIVFGKLNL